MAKLTRVYLVPGMFGFGKLAGYDYFHHFRVALEKRFADAGKELITEVIPTPPTSSLRFRARMLAKAIRNTSGDDDNATIHLVGHSTGGLDIRLALSPTTNLGSDDPHRLDWRPRVGAALSLNTPHFGTPLAGYFATVSGTRVLYALSLLTVVSMSVGAPSLAVFSKLLAGLGSIEEFFGDRRLVRRLTDLMLQKVAHDSQHEITEFLSKIRTDQGGIVQIMPEAMDLFNAAAEDDPNVRYGSVLTSAPPPQAMRFAKRIRSPYAALTAAMYSTLYQFTAQKPSIYDYAEPDHDQLDNLRRGIPHELDETDNDGIVPTLSQLWGQLVWCGEGDHLDVLGYFHDDHPDKIHVDWMTSGSHFDRQRFFRLTDAVADFLLEED